MQTEVTSLGLERVMWTSVVMETIRRRSFTYSEIKKRFLLAPPKIPPEFQKHKKEYLSLRGIDILSSKFHDFYVKNSFEAPNVFESPICLRLEKLLKSFLKGQKYGYLGDLSEVNFKFSYLRNLVKLKKLFEDEKRFPEILPVSFREALERFDKIFYQVYNQLNINKETREEFIIALEPYNFVKDYANIRLFDLFEEGYNSNDLAVMYENILRREDEGLVDENIYDSDVEYVFESDGSDSGDDSDSDVYFIPRHNSESDSDSESEFEMNKVN